MTRHMLDASGEPVKRWIDCRTPMEREAAIAEALQTYETITAAAQALGVSRRHLTRLLGATARLAEKRETRSAPFKARLAETRSLTPDSETRSLTETRQGRSEASTGETPSDSASGIYLTRAPHEPSLTTTMSTLATDSETRESADREPYVERVKVGMDLAKDCVEWVELKALKRKQASGASRPSKALVVEELIRKAMREEEGE